MSGIGRGGPGNKRGSGVVADGLQWWSPGTAPLALSGFAWFEREGRYRRLPVNPSNALPASVDKLANHTAGGQVRFRSDSRQVRLRARLDGPADMDHMPSTGQCGFDLYVKQRGQEGFWGVSRFNPKRKTCDVSLFSHDVARLREFRINFPLYQGVKKVEIGLDRGARVLEPAPYAADGPIVFYGSSITQGGCASRPGMAYPNILGRRLNADIVNLGFSGSGRGEAEVAEVVATVPDPFMFVLDYEANCADRVRYRRTLPRFVRILRRQHACVPILVVSVIRFGRERMHEGKRQRLERLTFQRDWVRDKRKDGDKHLYFLDGSRLLGSDYDECTVDSVHPTDLGFLRMAEGLAPMVRRILFGRG